MAGLKAYVSQTLREHGDKIQKGEHDNESFFCQSMGADWKTAEILRKGFAEPTAFHDAGTTIPNEAQNGMQKLERARN